MRSYLIVLVGLVIAASAFATDTGTRPPIKAAAAAPPHTPDPNTIRQGGDTIADAVVIPGLPYTASGTTTGYTDDYDEVCPYEGSTSPDVVYTFTTQAAKLIDIDLYGSSYDTKIYVYDAQLNLVACNDDFYPDYVSKLEALELLAHRPYYLVIDGYGGEFGDYLLAVTEHEPCDMTCSPIAMLEGEPPLVDDYEDTYNCGCNCLPEGLFQDIPGDPSGHRIFCGVSGWYLSDGVSHRDTDWFHLAVPAGGTVTLEIVAEMPTYVFDVDLYCSLGINQNIVASPCEPATMTFVAGDVPLTDRIIIIPTTYEGPSGLNNEYNYELRLSGLEPAPVAVETQSWTTVKALFR